MRDDWSTLRKLMFLKGSTGLPLVEYTATGNPLSFETNVAKPLLDLICPFTPVQSGTGDPFPPGGGVNKWDEEWVVGRVESDGSIDATSTSRRTTSFIPVTPGTTYLQVSPSSALQGRYAYYDENKDFLYYEQSGIPSTGLFTAREGAYYIRITFGSGYGTTYNHDISINNPSSDTSYHPYSNIRPISGWTGVNAWHTGKNMANVVGYSATSIADGEPSTTTNNYGTTINTTSPSAEVVVTQSSSTTDYVKTSYRNGFVIIRFEPIIEFNKPYDISFKVTNIVSNPLEATLSDILVLSPSGANLTKPDFKGDTLIFRNAMYLPHPSSKRTTIEIRICGMSCTLSDFMITAPNTSDGEYTPYTGNTYSVVFPAMGVNQFDGVLENGNINSSGVPSGSSKAYVRSTNYIPCLPSTAYYFYYVKSDSAASNMKVFYYEADKTFISSMWISPGSITTPANARYIKFYMDSAYTALSNRDIGINYPATNTSYEPYTNTVYGGTLDLTTGVLTVNREYLVDTGSDESKWGVTSQSETIARFTKSKNNFPYTPKNDSTSNLLTNYFKSSQNLAEWNAFIGSTGNFLCYVPKSVAETKREWCAYLAENPLHIVYELDESYTIQLTPQQITALIGDNTIWSDTNGSNTATFYKKG